VIGLRFNAFRWRNQALTRVETISPRRNLCRALPGFAANFTKSLALAISAVGVCANSPAKGQGQVYDPLPPPGSAYVRFVNSLDDDLEVRPNFLPSQRLGATFADRVTPYFVVEKVAGRDLVFMLKDATRAGQVTLRAEAGTFVTIVAQAGSGQDIGAVPVIDKTDFNQTRARLSFYNTTVGCPSATLALADSGTAVFQDVAPGSAKARSVNPVEADVVASCVGRKAPAFALRGIEAGGMYSAWLMPHASEATAFLTRDVTARWKP